MGTVYSTKERHVFETELFTYANGIKYAIDATDISSIKAFPLRELITLGESFDVICRYYPGYDSCDEAAWLDDLDCLIGNECDEDKYMRATADWGSDPEYWEQKRDELYNRLLSEAIEHYKSINSTIF